jgi:hypothetical protein
MMRLAASSLLIVAALLGGVGSPAPHAGSRVAATPQPLLSTREGPALRIGPPGSEHFVGLLANGEGALGVAVAADGAFLAFTCGMAARTDVWFSGDWYRGRLTAEDPVTVPGPDGEHLTLSRGTDGSLTGELAGPEGARVSAKASFAGEVDGLFRRDDADGVLGAVALPGNTVCAVKRRKDGRLLPAGTVPY